MKDYEINRLNGLQTGSDCLPHTVYLELTNRYNFKHQECPAPPNKFIDFNYEWAKKLCYFLPENKINRVVLTGGEPTLHPEFQDILVKFKIYGFNIGLETSGELLGKSVELFARRCSWIKIPIETHDCDSFGINRNCHPGRLQDILFNLRRLRDEIRNCKTKCKIIIEVPYSKINKDIFSQMVEELYYLGKNTSMLVYPHVSNAVCFTDDIDGLVSKWDGHERYNGFSVVIDPSQKTWGLIPLKKRNCYHHFFNSYIAADGTVYRCRDRRDEASIFGSLSTNEWADIWDGMLRTNSNQNFNIKDCPFYCNGATTNIETDKYLTEQQNVIHSKP
jgi:MoaA/NifB/PqqE/SkfB family radical SAM enzyme